MNRNRKLHASCAGFIQDGLVITDNPTGCLRNLLINSYLNFPQRELNQRKITANYQNLYLQFIKSDLIDNKLEGNGIIDGNSENFSFVTKEGNVRVIHELKADLNDEYRKKIGPDARTIDISHLAQLIFYLIILEEMQGKIIVTHYRKSNNRTLIKTSQLVYQVKIDLHGNIYVDNKQTPYTVHDQIMHQLKSARVLKDQIIDKRPLGKSVCKRCPFQKTCNSFDQKCLSSIGEFVASAKEELDAKVKEKTTSATTAPKKLDQKFLKNQR